MGVLKRIERRKKSKIRKALKSYHGRFWKNLAIFMAGVFSSGFILAGVSALVLKFVPLKNVTGDNTDKVVSSELADKSILDVLVGFKDATVDDYVFVTTLIDALQNADVAGKKLRDFVYIDTEKLSGTKLLELGPALKDAVKVTATLKSVFGDKLASIGIDKFTALYEYEKVLNEDGTQKTVADIKDTEFNAKEYYYQVEEGVWARAFNDDNSLADGVSDSTLLHYAALVETPITDAMTFIGPALGRIKAMELLETFSIGSDTIIGKIIKDRTITELGNLKLEGIYLYDLLENIYPTGYIKDDGVEITEGELFADILIQTKNWVDDEGNPLDLTTNEKWESLSFGDITTSLNVDGIKVSTVFKTATEEIKSLFVDLVNSNKEDGAANLTWEDITIGDLQNIDGFDSVKLSSVMIDVYPTGYNTGTETNPNYVESGSLMADILIDANAPWDEGEYPDINAKWDSLTVSDITSLGNFNSVKLSTVMPEITPSEYDEDGNKTQGNMLADILLEINAPDEWDELTVEHITSFSNIDEVKLSTVLPKMDEDSFFAKVLIEATTENDAWGDIKVGALTGGASDAALNFDNVKLSTVMGNDNLDPKMETILRQAFDVSDSEELKVQSLKREFTPTNIKLSTLGISAGEDKDGDGVVDEGEENKILKAILGDPNTTVGNIGTTINNLSLYEIYGEECFTKDPEQAVDTDTKFRFEEELYEKAEDGEYYKTADDNYTKDVTLAEDSNVKYKLCQGYVHDNSGEYYLHKNDGIWLLLCFTGYEIDQTTGRPEHYVLTDLTFQDLEQGSALTGKFENATIRQLVDAGLLEVDEDFNTLLFPYTLYQVLHMDITIS